MYGKIGQTLILWFSFCLKYALLCDTVIVLGSISCERGLLACYGLGSTE